MIFRIVFLALMFRAIKVYGKILQDLNQQYSSLKFKMTIEEAQLSDLSGYSRLPRTVWSRTLQWRINWVEALFRSYHWKIFNISLLHNFKLPSLNFFSWLKQSSRENMTVFFFSYIRYFLHRLYFII